jgi:hypothetical protein
MFNSSAIQRDESRSGIPAAAFLALPISIANQSTVKL